MRESPPEGVTGDAVAALRRNPGVRLPSTPITNWREEQLASKETCFLGTWSFMPDVHVEGPDARDLFEDICVNSLDGFPVGRAKHVVNCNGDGNVIGDGLLIHVDEDAYQYQNVAGWTLYTLETGSYRATGAVRDSFIYQVQGPDSVDVMRAVTGTSFDDFDFMDARRAEIEGIDVLVVRMGMSGEVGFELHGPKRHGDEIYDALLEGGRQHGIREISSSRVNMVEMGIPTAGFTYLPAIYGDDMRAYREWLADFDEGRDWVDWSTWNADYAVDGSFDPDDVEGWYRSPFELGWADRISFDGEFVGRSALEAEVDDPSRSLVTLRWDPDDVLAVDGSFYGEGDHYKYMELPQTARRTVEADLVTRDGSTVGISTERAYSYYFREMISLCSIDVGHADPGTPVTVHWGEGGAPACPAIEPHRRTEISATVAPAPYIEDRRRKDLASRS